jgi:hypothetical protein
MHDDHDHAAETDQSLETPAPPPVQLKGQHLYFVVRGTSSQDAYDAAKEKGVRVLDVRRLRQEIPPETEEIEIDHPQKKGEKMKVEVMKKKQAPVYVAVDTDSDQDDRRRARHSNLEATVESEFTFIVKASAPRV